MRKNDLSQIMRTAHLFAKTRETDMSDSLRLSWANYKLVDTMKKEVVRFRYKKNDGTIREASGTLRGMEDVLKRENRKLNKEFIQVYFDVEKNEWRSFKKACLLI